MIFFEGPFNVYVDKRRQVGAPKCAHFCLRLGQRLSTLRQVGGQKRTKFCLLRKPDVSIEWPLIFVISLSCGSCDFILFKVNLAELSTPTIKQEKLNTLLTPFSFVVCIVSTHYFQAGAVNVTRFKIREFFSILFFFAFVIAQFLDDSCVKP